MQTQQLQEQQQKRLMAFFEDFSSNYAGEYLLASTRLQRVKTSTSADAKESSFASSADAKATRETRTKIPLIQRVYHLLEFCANRQDCKALLLESTHCVAKKMSCTKEEEEERPSLSDLSEHQMLLGDLVVGCVLDSAQKFEEACALHKVLVSAPLESTDAIQLSLQDLGELLAYMWNKLRERFDSRFHPWIGAAQFYCQTLFEENCTHYIEANADLETTEFVPKATGTAGAPEADEKAKSTEAAGAAEKAQFPDALRAPLPLEESFCVMDMWPREVAEALWETRAIGVRCMEVVFHAEKIKSAIHSKARDGATSGALDLSGDAFKDESEAYAGLVSSLHGDCVYGALARQVLRAAPKITNASLSAFLLQTYKQSHGDVSGAASSAESAATSAESAATSAESAASAKSASHTLFFYMEKRTELKDLFFQLMQMIASRTQSVLDTWANEEKICAAETKPQTNVDTSNATDTHTDSNADERGSESASEDESESASEKESVASNSSFQNYPNDDVELSSLIFKLARSLNTSHSEVLVCAAMFFSQAKQVVQELFL